MFKNKKLVIINFEALLNTDDINKQIDEELISKSNGTTNKQNLYFIRNSFLNTKKDSIKLNEEYLEYFKENFNINISLEKLKDLKDKLIKIYSDKIDYKVGAFEFIKLLNENGLDILIFANYGSWKAKINSDTPIEELYFKRLLDIFKEFYISKKGFLNQSHRTYCNSCYLQNNSNECISIESSLEGVKTAFPHVEVICVLDKNSYVDQAFINSLANYTFTDFIKLSSRFNESRRKLVQNFWLKITIFSYFF